ncbi:Uncharacterised protein [uncultured archaeon]|nr:Uncharacterised protein [uncultured archaeon]
MKILREIAENRAKQRQSEAGGNKKKDKGKQPKNPPLVTKTSQATGVSEDKDKKKTNKEILEQNNKTETMVKGMAKTPEASGSSEDKEKKKDNKDNSGEMTQTKERAPQYRDLKAAQTGGSSYLYFPLNGSVG